MKFVNALVIAGCMLVVHPGQAQDVARTTTEFQRTFEKLTLPDDHSYNEKKYKKFKRMRTTGIVLTSVGVASIIGSVIFISSTGVEKLEIGVAGAVLGGYATAGGIVFWSVGQRKMKRYGNLSLRQSNNGIGLTFSF